MYMDGNRIELDGRPSAVAGRKSIESRAFRRSADFCFWLFCIRYIWTVASMSPTIRDISDGRHSWTF